MLKLLLMFSCILFASCELKFSNSNNFGPYVVEMESLEGCVGHFKSTIGTSNLSLINNANGNQSIYGNLTLFKNIKRPQFKIHIQQNTKKGFVSVLKRHEQNMCECVPCAKKLYSMAAKFKTYDEECNIEKGSSVFTINPNQWMHDLLGEVFFYVKFRMRIFTFIKNENIYCVVASGQIKKN